MLPETRRMAALLGLGALLFLLAVVLAAGGKAEALRQGTAAQQRAQADAALRAGVAQLETFLFEVDGFVLKAEPVSGIAPPPRDAEVAYSPTIIAALKGALAAPTAPGLASASVYQDIEADEVEVPFVLLGFAAADGAPLGAMPEEVLWSELEHADATGGSTSLVWFSPDVGSGVRLHLAGTAMHEDTEAQTAHLRLMHVSMPFAAPAGVAVDVRCDVAGGIRAAELPLHTVAGGEDDESTEAMRPLDMPRIRWPVKEDTRPRAVVHFAGHATSWTVYLLVLLALTCLGMAGHRLMRPVVAPSDQRPSDEDPSDEAPASEAPAPEAP